MAVNKFSPLFVLLIIWFGAGCRYPANKSPAENTGTEHPVADMHNARIALDYAGAYRGIVPCADCEGIETTLILTENGKYLLQTVYIGKSDQVFEKSGNYSWNDTGNTVILDGITQGPGRYFVGENRLFQLDSEGNRITGDLAERYILNKFEMQ